MTKQEALARIEKFLDHIEPDLLALRQDLLESEYRLVMVTEPNGMSEFQLKTLPKAKQSRSA